MPRRASRRTRFEQRRFEHYISGAHAFLSSRNGRVVTIEEARCLLETAPPLRNGRFAIASRKATLLGGLPSRHRTSELLNLNDFGARRAAMTVMHSYVTPVLLALESAQIDVDVIVTTGDVTHGLPLPTICKARNIDDPGCNILTPLEYERHFEPAYRMVESRVPLRKKADRLMWRGAFTGPTKTAIHRRGQSREWIFDLAQRTKNDSRIDVGITRVPPDRTADRLSSAIEQWSGEAMTPEEMAENKLLLCVEGNDVSSGLKWMLASGSCVLMPEPTVDSWFCESFLEPWVHFVPVSSDLADVEEKVDWCLSHPRQTAKIGSQARRYTAQFLSGNRETELFGDVLRWYCAQPEFREILSRPHQVLEQL